MIYVYIYSASWLSSYEVDQFYLLFAMAKAVYLGPPDSTIWLFACLDHVSSVAFQSRGWQNGRFCAKL
jgi:hypothetical protein